MSYFPHDQNERSERNPKVRYLLCHTGCEVCRSLPFLLLGGGRRGNWTLQRLNTGCPRAGDKGSFKGPGPSCGSSLPVSTWVSRGQPGFVFPAGCWWAERWSRGLKALVGAGRAGIVLVRGTSSFLCQFNALLECGFSSELRASASGSGLGLDGVTTTRRWKACDFPVQGCSGWGYRSAV